MKSDTPTSPNTEMTLMIDPRHTSDIQLSRAEQEQQGTDWSAKSPCLKLCSQENHLPFLNKDWKSLVLSNYSSNPCWYFTLEEIHTCQALNSRKSLRGCFQDSVE